MINDLKQSTGLAPLRNSAGFTLIELMVTMLILAIGVLGLGRLQIETYQHLRQAQYQGSAATLAGDIADRIVANATEALRNSYTPAPDGEIDASDIVLCDGSICPATQLAQQELAQWYLSLKGQDSSGQILPGALPSGKGIVNRVSDTDSFLVTVYWDADLSGSEGTHCPIRSDADLDCYQLTVSL